MRCGRELLQENMILADGAMGTWYAQLSGQSPSDCELANLEQPELIRRIHQDYLAAGASLLRTNTFAAAMQADPENPARLSRIIESGWEIAVSCAGPEHYVAADLGPVYGLEPEQAEAAMAGMLDTFIRCGADLFLFETFSDPEEVLPWCRFIRERLPEAVVITSFTLSPDGLTRKGIPLSRLARILEAAEPIDIWGLNCGIGPTHLREQIDQLPAQGRPLSLMPNSGYPRLENQRLVYGSTPAYFAETLLDLKRPRTRIIGGCCGTTPKHIAAVSGLLEQKTRSAQPGLSITTRREPAVPAHYKQPRLEDQLAEAKRRKRPLLVCELDPPRNSDLSNLIDSARLLRDCGIDALTIADSPLARVKLDSVTCAARLCRETGLCVIPHLCCRDRNANALRSSLLAAHSEGIRQILAITGDAIPESDRGFIKPVFNFNSIGLLDLIRQMNEDLFIGEPMLPAAALDPAAPNPQAEMRRARQKQAAGARIFLTQPVYDRQSLPLIRQVRQEGMKVLVGLMPLITYRNAMFMSQEVPGIRIPDQILAGFHAGQSREESLAVGMEQTRELAREFQADTDGFYLIAPFNRADIIAQICRDLPGRDKE